MVASTGGLAVIAGRLPLTDPSFERKIRVAGLMARVTLGKVGAS